MIGASWKTPGKPLTIISTPKPTPAASGYNKQQYDDAIASFEKAVQAQKLSENEPIVDTWFWLARTHLRRNDPTSARPYLAKIAASEVKYEKKAQAAKLLQTIA